MRRVVDASALLSGASLDGELYTTPEAVSEVRRHGSTPQLDAILDTKVRVLTPAKDALSAVEVAARETGDIARLSPADRGLLALAQALGASLLTDDYSIQNVASRMGIPYEAVLERGIREVVRWRYRCTGCGRFFADPTKECRVCGSRVTTTRARAQSGGGGGRASTGARR
jgi:endoribonuclease Nob1